MTGDHGAFDAGLPDLRDLGLLINDRDLAEKLIRVVGALAALHDQHAFDNRGRCVRCRPSGWRLSWRPRRKCTVYDALATYRVGVAALRRTTL